MKKLAEFAGNYHKADPALAVTIKFVMVGIIWILFSDSLLFFLGTDNILWKLAHVHILKGLFFVGVTGGFLFFWTNRHMQSLQKREAEVKNLFESSPIAMGIMDAQTFRFLEINESLVKLFGLAGSQLRDLVLSDLAVEKERFEVVPLLIKTGSRELGAWQFAKADRTISVDLSAQLIREKRAYLIIFTDVTNQVRNAKDLEVMRVSIEKRMDEQLRHLTRLNEELAYRASQTEHVNAELISVNEQLQHVNKKIALRSEDAIWKNERTEAITTALSDVFWSFDLTGRSKCFVSPSAEALFEEPYENLIKPWFWIDFIHPDDKSAKEIGHRQLMDAGFSASTYRIVTKAGKTKLLLCRMRLFHDPKGIPMLIGCATDISETNGDFGKTMLADSKVKLA
jgi:PAS domain S-box-containing protein